MLKLDDLKKSKNIAELLDEEKLIEIGNQVFKGYEIDEVSRNDWKNVVDEAMKIAKQMMETKSFPWENASNIKFPLITQASIDYASRTMPEIIQNDRVVKTVVIGKDPDESKYRRATRVSKFMSYQLMELSMGWQDETDMLLQVLPVLGTVFKKTYYDPIEKYNCSELCVPDKIVVNYDTQSLEKARRITHILTLFDNDIVERQRLGIFCDFDLNQFTDTNANQEDCDHSRELLEQHCWIDLDDDGYKEPYVVTIHKDTHKVLRIVHRFDEILKNKDGKVLKIIPCQYFTDFHFIRSPDGGFYSMGFGSLLLPINKGINTLINQLIDSGTLNNMQGGLIGRGLRIKNGQIRFKMGEYQVLDAASGDDIRKSVFPWPTKEPSQTLFSLLSLLMQVGKDLSSTTDVLAGKQPAQNVASGTISQLVEQGTKVFIAINKRLYRSLKKEYKKLFDLNRKYLTQDQYISILDDEEADVKKDFALAGLDVLPVADPTVSTENQRLSRAGALMNLRTVDPREADRLFLESMQLDEAVIKKLLPEKDPNEQPPPEVQKMLAEIQQIQANIAKISAEATLQAETNQLNQQKLIIDAKESESRVNESAARSWKMQQDAAHNFQKTSITNKKMESEQQLKEITLLHQIDQDKADVMLKGFDAEHKQKVDTANLVLQNKQIDKESKKDES